MSWLDRLQEAAYIAPSGNRFVFDYMSTEQNFEHNASVYRFPNKDGAYVKSLGTGEDRFPIDAYIHGPDYDLTADAFITVLKERGNGVLEHPSYGNKLVQVTRVKRVDNFADGSGLAVISIEFVESTELSYPTTDIDLIQELLARQNTFNQQTSDNYAANQQYFNSIEKVNSESRFLAMTASIDSILRPIAELTEATNLKFKSINNFINNNITELIGKPVVLASQIVSLIKTPARIVQSAELRIEGYKQLADQFFQQINISPNSNDNRNQVIESTIAVSAVVAALAETVLFADYTTKNQALSASSEVQTLFDSSINFIESNEQLFQVDVLEELLYGDTDAYNTLNDIVQKTSGRLSYLAFELRQEKVIVINRERSVIDLVFELYNNSDDNLLNEFILANNLQNDRIVLIPQGTEIIYYD